MINFLNSGFLLAIIYFIFLIPGRVISDLIFGSIHQYKNIISITFSFSFFVLISIVFFVFEWKLINLNISILTTFALSAFYLIKKNKPIFDYRKLMNFDNIQVFVVALFLVLFLTQSNILMVSSGNQGSDYWYYAAQSNFYVESERLSLQFPYFNATNSTYPFSFIFTMVALLELNIGWPSIKIINHLGSVFVITSIYLNYSLLDYFVKDRVISILSIFLTVMLTYYFKDGIFYVFLSYPFYPKLVSMFLFFPIFILTFLHRKTFGSNYLIFIVALIIPFINMHVQNSLWLMLYLLALAFVEILKTKTISANLVYLVLIGTLIVLINAILIFNFIYSEGASVFQYSNQNTNGVLVNHLNMTFVNPMNYFNERGLFGIGINAIALITSICLLFIRRNYLIIYTSILLAIILIITLNPFFVEMFLKIMPYFIFERFIYLFPIIFIYSYLITLILKYLCDIFKISFNKKNCTIVLILLSISIFSIDKNGSKISQDSADFYKFFKNNIEKDAYILADGVTAYKLPALKKIKVPFINEGFLDGHIDPIDKKNVSLIFSEDIIINEKVSIIMNYDFDYIVVNKNKKNNNFLKSGVQNYSEIFSNNEYQILSRFK